MKRKEYKAPTAKCLTISTTGMLAYSLSTNMKGTGYDLKYGEGADEDIEDR